MENLNLTPIKNLSDEFVQLLRQTLASNGTNSSGQLSKSIKSIVKQNGKWIEISISLDDYWKYVEYGTKPHFPPIEAIRKWIRVKPILPKPLQNGKLPTENQLAFLIARKISKVGTRPQPFFTKSIEQFDLINKVYDVVIKSIEEQINNEIDNELE